MRTGLTSGKVTYTNVHVTYGSIDLYNMTQASYKSDAGDSGSPVFASYEAWGIHSGNPFLPGTTTRDTSKSWYTSIGEAAGSLTLKVCWDVNCQYAGNY